MNSKDSTPPAPRPGSLDRETLQSSFKALRQHYPALALQLRNSMTLAGDGELTLPPGTVHDVVAALSCLSKKRGDSVRSRDLLSLRKLLLIWMEYELARIKQRPS